MCGLASASSSAAQAIEHDYIGAYYETSSCGRVKSHVMLVRQVVVLFTIAVSSCFRGRVAQSAADELGPNNDLWPAAAVAEIRELFCN